MDMHDIKKLKEMLMEELAEYGKGKELTMGSLDMVDKLAHATKNLCKIVESGEEEEYSRAEEKEDELHDIVDQLRSMAKDLPQPTQRAIQNFTDMVG